MNIGLNINKEIKLHSYNRKKKIKKINNNK